MSLKINRKALWSRYMQLSVILSNPFNVGRWWERDKLLREKDEIKRILVETSDMNLHRK